MEKDVISTPADLALAIQNRKLPRDYHAPRWNEPLIFQLHVDGESGLRVPTASTALRENLSKSPEARVRRAKKTNLPQVGQPQVLRHFLRLSQETLGADLNVDIGQGTCTMKYSPKVNEEIISNPRAANLHPLQPESTVQGTLQILWELEQYLSKISGMDAISLQAPAGSAAIYGNVQIVKTYHASRGETLEHRDEVITTIYSHPSNSATARAAGYKVITLYPGENGFVELDALKAVLSERTAALLVTNPEDTGIFNSDIRDLVDAAHTVGALAVYDQANANGLLGITTARAAGFDLCHFNLHKTFSTPHACGGPAAGAIGATAELEKFLPGPRVRKMGEVFALDHDNPSATAPLRPFYGVIPNLIRAYSWIRALGPDGLREAAEVAVLNNNYVLHKLKQVDGIAAAYLGPDDFPIEQVRYSWEKLAGETGISTAQIGQRMADFGFHYWTSHHPYIVPEPVTIEPTESYSRRELDEYIAALAQIADEARNEPELVRSAPHRSTIHAIDDLRMNDPETWAMTWRAVRRKHLNESIPVPRHWEAPESMPARERPTKIYHR